MLDYFKSAETSSNKKYLVANIEDYEVENKDSKIKVYEKELAFRMKVS